MQLYLLTWHAQHEFNRASVCLQVLLIKPTACVFIQHHIADKELHRHCTTEDSICNTARDRFASAVLEIPLRVLALVLCFGTSKLVFILCFWY